MQLMLYQCAVAVVSNAVDVVSMQLIFCALIVLGFFNNATSQGVK